MTLEHVCVNCILESTLYILTGTNTHALYGYISFMYRGVNNDVTNDPRGYLHNLCNCKTET